MKYIKYFIFLFILSIAISCGQQKKYVEYKVKSGETLRSIAKDNDLNLSDILKLNPAISARPAENSIIYLPSIKEKVKEELEKDKNEDDTSKKLDSINNKSQKEIDLESLKEQYIIHEVKKGDTFYSITRFYNVTKEQLIALNPLLIEGLKQDTYIKIREIVVIDEEELESTVIYQDNIESGTNIKAALMLPFMAEQLDTLTPNLIFDNNRLANIVTDFYFGAQIAIDSLKKQGITIDLTLYDTGLRNTKINSIMEEGSAENFDVVFGPLYSEEAEKVANFLRVPTVFPVFSRNQSSFDSSKLIKTQPEEEAYRNTMFSYIHKIYDNQHVVVVSKDSIKGLTTIENLKEHDSINEITLVTPKEGYLRKEDLVNALKSNENNWVVIDTKDNILAESTVNSLIALPTVEEIEKAIEEEEEVKMQGIGDSTLVRLFSFEKVRSFDKIDNNKLAKLNYTFTSDIFANEYSSRVRNFNSTFLRKYNSLPSYYASKGFDITYDILIRMASGNNLRSTFNEGISYRLESKFDYDNIFFKPTSNKGVYVIKYNEDLTLTRLK